MSATLRLGEPAQRVGVAEVDGVGVVVDEAALAERPKGPADVLAARPDHAGQVAVGEVQRDPGPAVGVGPAVVGGQAEQGLGQAALDVQGQQVVDQGLTVGQPGRHLAEQGRGGGRVGLKEAPERGPADGPGGGGRGRPGPGRAPAVVQQGELADQLPGPDDRMDQLATAADGGDDRHLAGGQHQHVVGGFALAHQEAAHRIVERGRLGGHGGQGVRPPLAEDQALAEHLEQRRLVGLGPPSGHLPISPPGREPARPGVSAPARRRTRALAPIMLAWSAARLAATSASSSRPARRRAAARSASDCSWSSRWPVGSSAARDRSSRATAPAGSPEAAASLASVRWSLARENTSTSWSTAQARATAAAASPRSASARQASARCSSASTSAVPSGWVVSVIASEASRRAATGRPRAIATWVRPSSDHSRLRVKPTSRLSRLPSAKCSSAVSRSSWSQATSPRVTCAAASGLRRPAERASAASPRASARSRSSGVARYRRSGSRVARSSMTSLAWPARRAWTSASSSRRPAAARSPARYGTYALTRVAWATRAGSPASAASTMARSAAAADSPNWPKVACRLDSSVQALARTAAWDEP